MRRRQFRIRRAQRLNLIKDLMHLSREGLTRKEGLMKSGRAFYGKPSSRALLWPIYVVNLAAILVFSSLPACAQGNGAGLTLTLDRGDYCSGDPWKLEVGNAPASAAIRLLGISNGVPWDIRDWATTDPLGHYGTTGAFNVADQGVYQLSVEVGGMSSSAFSFSVSNCREWTLVNGHLSDSDITSLAVDPLSPDTLYAGTAGHGVFKSTNAGADWMPTGLVDVQVNILAEDANTPYPLHAGNNIYAGTNGKGLLRSTDGGLTWHSVGPDIANINLIMIPPQSQWTILAGNVDSSAGTLFKSIDWGDANSWIQITLPSPWTSFIAIDPENPDVIYQLDYGYKGMDDVGYLRKTIDGGKTWDSTDLHDVGSIRHMVIDPTRSDTIYAYTDQLKALRSTDGAKTWESYGLPIDALVADLAGTLYATSQGVIYRSTNHGDSWNSLNGGTTWKAQAMAVPRSNPATVFAATTDREMYDNSGWISLTLDRSDYCVGDSWDLDIANSQQNSPVQLMGISNGVPWEIKDWVRTDPIGHYSATGTFSMDDQGFYQLSVASGGNRSNVVSFTVSTCSGAGDWDY
jgi:photosystem II stability/assembly factor-like uncharacterized protein